MSLKCFSLFFFFLKIIIFSLFLSVLGLLCCEGYSLLLVPAFLLWFGAQAFGCVSLSSCSMWPQKLWLPGLVALRHVGIFPDQGSNPCPRHWQMESLPLSHQGSPAMPPEALQGGSL